MTSENIILIGPMGAGKSSIGRKLAQRLRWKFYDLDTVIESKTGVDIPTVFEIEGESGFRKRESLALKELLGQSKIVLASGGGVVLKKENRRLLQSSGFIIYLAASIQSQLNRTRRDRSRPLLQTADRRATLERMAEHRNPLYNELADYTVSTDRKAISEAIKEILATLKKNHII